MPAFPLLCFPVISETLCMSAKFGRVDTPAAVHALTGDQCMQHLVEDDIFNHILRDKRLIKQSVDADHSISHVIRPKTDRRARPLQWSSRPGDAGLDAVGKVCPI